MLDFCFVDFHFLSDFCVGRLTVKILRETTLCAKQLVDGLDHVHRNANSACLVCDGTRDSLANPPCRIRAKLEAFVWVELFNCAEQAGVTLLDKIEQIKSAANISFRDGNDKAHVGFRHLVFRLFVTRHDPLREIKLFFGVEQRNLSYFAEI